MEIAVAAEFPTYAGGLGVLAGDMLRSAADLGIPMVGVTLVHRQGYFHQELDGVGRQFEKPDEWHPESLLEPIEQAVPLNLNGQRIKVRPGDFHYWMSPGTRSPSIFWTQTCRTTHRGSDR